MLDRKEQKKKKVGPSIPLLFFVHRLFNTIKKDFKKKSPETDILFFPNKPNKGEISTFNPLKGPEIRISDLRRKLKKHQVNRKK